MSRKLGAKTVIVGVAVCFFGGFAFFGFGGSEDYGSSSGRRGSGCGPVAAYSPPPGPLDTWIVDNFDNGGFLEGFCPIDPEFPPPAGRPYKAQVGQDCVLRKIFSTIGETNRFFVEFGFNEGCYTCGGSGANSWDLYDRGWRGLLLDADRENATINLQRHFLYRGNVGGIFEKHQVPKELDFLSADMESHDFFVVMGILEAGFRPRVLMVEINSNYGGCLSDTYAMVDPTLDGGKPPSTWKFAECAWSGSAGANVQLMAKYGYTLVWRAGRLDLVFMRTDVIPKNMHVPPPAFFLRGLSSNELHHGTQTTPCRVNDIVDTAVYLETGSVEKARKAAAEGIARKYARSPCWGKVAKQLPAAWDSCAKHP